MGLKNFKPKINLSTDVITLSESYQTIFEISESFGAIDDININFSNTSNTTIKITFDDEIYYEGSLSDLKDLDNENIIVTKKKFCMKFGYPLFFSNNTKLEAKNSSNNKKVINSIVRYRGE